MYIYTSISKFRYGPSSESKVFLVHFPSQNRAHSRVLARFWPSGRVQNCSKFDPPPSADHKRSKFDRLCTHLLQSLGTNMLEIRSKLL